MGIFDSLQERFARFSAHGIRGRAIAFAFAASFTPMAVLFYATAGAESSTRFAAVIAMASALFALIFLIRSLRPVSDLAALLDQLAGSDDDSHAIDHHARLIANARALAERMKAEAERASVHPVSGLPVREQLRSVIAADLRGRADAPALLGLIRIANFDHLAAFDPVAANRLLANVSHHLSAATGPARPLAHVDRDCFAIWFGQQKDAKAAASELQALAYVLVQEQRIGSFSLTPDIQVGSALYPIDAEEADNLINRAFVSLARPQRASDGAIAFFARPSHQEARRRFLLEQELRQAIRRGELALHYQPVVDLSAGRVVGAEALLRWRSGGEQATPSQIVKVLEEIGLVHEVGLWTLNSACRQLRAWRDHGLSDLKVAVNLSAQQLRDATLPSALKRTLATHGLSPAQIELELTETAAMEDAARTRALFQELREAGFSLAIDDFGSGYSSLSYLRRLPFQKLKIDREFVTHVDERAGSRTICKALIDLSAGLELSVLAEGVERLEEVEALRALGCAKFQGYYFSRPLPPEEFVATVTNPDWIARMRSPVHREREELRRRLQ